MDWENSGVEWGNLDVDWGNSGVEWGIQAEMGDLGGDRGTRAEMGVGVDWGIRTQSGGIRALIGEKESPLPKQWALQ